MLFSLSPLALCEYMRPRPRVCVRVVLSLSIFPTLCLSLHTISIQCSPFCLSLSLFTLSTISKRFKIRFRVFLICSMVFCLVCSRAVAVYRWTKKWLIFLIGSSHTPASLSLFVGFFSHLRTPFFIVENMLSSVIQYFFLLFSVGSVVFSLKIGFYSTRTLNTSPQLSIKRAHRISFKLTPSSFNFSDFFQWTFFYL